MLTWDKRNMENMTICKKGRLRFKCSLIFFVVRVLILNMSDSFLF